GAVERQAAAAARHDRVVPGATAVRIVAGAGVEGVVAVVALEVIAVADLVASAEDVVAAAAAKLVLPAAAAKLVARRAAVGEVVAGPEIDVLDVGVHVVRLGPAAAIVGDVVEADRERGRARRIRDDVRVGAAADVVVAVARGGLHE